MVLLVDLVAPESTEDFRLYRYRLLLGGIMEILLERTAKEQGIIGLRNIMFGQRAILRFIAISICLVTFFDDKVICQAKGPDMLLTAKVERISVKNDDPGSIRYEVQLRLQFTNSTQRPLIFLKNDFWIAGESVSLIEENDATLSTVYSSSHLSSKQGNLPEAIRWREKISQNFPPEDEFEILRPGQLFEVNITVPIFVLKKDKQYAEFWEAIKKNETAQLRIDVEMFPRGYDISSSDGLFTDNLRIKWKTIGDFQAGLFSSEPISVVFPRKGTQSLNYFCLE